jgi:hypothetical protein
MRADRLWRTRKEKKEWARRLQSNDLGLDVIHPQAAGIDVGKRFPLCGGASGSRSGTGTPVLVFHGRLYRLADWLKSCGVVTVATPFGRVLTSHSKPTSKGRPFIMRRLRGDRR